jgi:hypothetical protein
MKIPAVGQQNACPHQLYALVGNGFVLEASYQPVREDAVLDDRWDIVDRGDVM